MKKGNHHCQCSGPGFCQRHGVEKNLKEFELCSGQKCGVRQCITYWNAWERGKMPGQEAPVDEEERKILLVQDIIRNFGKEHFDQLIQSRMRPEKKNNVDGMINHLEKEENINLENIDDLASEGLGDTLEKVFKKFGVTEGLVKGILGKGCKCSQRKKFLNKLFPYMKEEKNE